MESEPLVINGILELKGYPTASATTEAKLEEILPLPLGYQERPKHQMFEEFDKPSSGAELLLGKGDLVIFMLEHDDIRQQLNQCHLDGSAKWYVGSFERYQSRRKDGEDKVVGMIVHLYATRRSSKSILDRPQLPLFQRVGRITRSRKGSNKSFQELQVIPYNAANYEKLTVPVRVDLVMPVANVRLTTARCVDKKGQNSSGATTPVNNATRQSTVAPGGGGVRPYGHHIYDRN